MAPQQPNQQRRLPPRRPALKPIKKESPMPKPTKEQLMECMRALGAAALPCLTKFEFQETDHPSPHPSSSPDVERDAKNFKDAADKLRMNLRSLEREDQRNIDISAMELEIEATTALLRQREQLIQGFRKELRDQLNRHKPE